MIDLRRTYAESLDANDELAVFRSRFLIADPDRIYMDGNSLGRLPQAAASRASQVVMDEWGEGLIGGWNAGWYEAPRRVGDAIGALIGAGPGQVIVTDSTSVNLFKLVAASLALRPERHRIITDSLNFPSDLYILQGAAELLGRGHTVVSIGMQAGGEVPDLGDLSAAVDSDTAIVVRSHAAYKSAYLYHMESVTRLAHERGALVVWDLSHSVGVVPIELDRWEVDFAVGCTYKYLNGGPGAPAFLYVSTPLQERARSPIWGWFGRDSPFAFDLRYEPAPGAARFLAGTPPILSLLVMEAALEPTIEAGTSRLRRKSVAQTEYLIALADELLAPLGVAVASPRESERRGSHVSLRHPEGYRVAQALIDEMKVIPDFREPDLLRFGCAPLYTTYADIWEAIDRTRRVIGERMFERYSPVRRGVT